MEQPKINVMIVEDNKEFCNILTDYLTGVSDINVCGIAHDGEAAIELTKAYKPDLIILDLIMPRLDGLGVLEKLDEMNLLNTLKIIVLSAVGQDKIIQKAIAMGVDYYMVKPFDISVLINRIRQFFEERTAAKKVETNLENLSSEKVRNISETDFLENQISEVLWRIGLPAHISGYKYIRDAIIMVVQDVQVLSSVTRKVYPSIAEKYHTTASRVERAIRHAIEVVWSRGHAEALEDIFGHALITLKERPTNSEVIGFISDHIRLNNRKHNNVI